MWAVNKNPAVWGVSISTRGCSMIKAPGLRPRAQLASLFCPQGGGVGDNSRCCLFGVLATQSGLEWSGGLNNFVLRQVLGMQKYM